MEESKKPYVIVIEGKGHPDRGGARGVLETFGPYSSGEVPVRLQQATRYVQDNVLCWPDNTSATEVVAVAIKMRREVPA
ncbi:hypothetical protein GCM10029976_090720 [Kribbella albertanoniae]|uniref:Uncharacterized protein n=1 Tax=Kribbella albertanoniae TaxID=1266829 RepID=A0A4R4PJE4_9ACTN|nr:hypothetical protein [Kribbella albertanoniae]TDC22142.1 hypothetical protein E1261_31630 [Kribbella albertanoniae]